MSTGRLAQRERLHANSIRFDARSSWCARRSRSTTARSRRSCSPLPGRCIDAVDCRAHYFNDFAAYDPLGTQGRAAAPLDEREVRSGQKSKSYAAFAQVTRGGAARHADDDWRAVHADERAVAGSTFGCTGATAVAVVERASKARRGARRPGEWRSIIASPLEGRGV